MLHFGTRVCLPALVLSLALATAGSAAFAATLTVDDRSATGSVGDDRLSLAEAIGVAGGVLSPDALSAAERARIQGEPGAGSADSVRVALRKPAILTTPAGAAFGLPFLTGNEGDVFDGGGAILQPAGALPGGAIGMLTRSSRIEIRRFSFAGYPLGLVIAATPGPDDLEQIRISGNSFSGYESGVVVVPNPSGSKGLRGLLIEGNRFATETGHNNAIAVLGASPDMPDAVAADYEVEDVVIRNNDIRGGVEGIGVFGGMAKPGTTVRDGHLHGVQIVGNRISDIFDLPIAVFAGFALGGGVVTRIEVSDVLVAGNRIATDGTPSIHIWVVSGTAVGEPGGLAEDNQLHDVAIARNRTSGGGECPGGIQLQASQNELGGGTVRGNVLERVSVLSNSVSACGSGLALFGAVAAAGHGLVEGNELRDVHLVGNRLTDNVRGVIVSGAAALEGSAFPLPMPEPALVHQNVVESVDVVRNRIRGGETGIVAIGGISSVTSDAVVANSVVDSFEADNAVRDASIIRCNVQDNVLLGDVGGSATDNHADFVCSP